MIETRLQWTKIWMGERKRRKYEKLDKKSWQKVSSQKGLKKTVKSEHFCSERMAPRRE